MGKKGTKDETADKAISNYKRKSIPMTLRYELERQCHKHGDEYSVTVLSKMPDVKKGKMYIDEIAKFTFSDDELRKISFTSNEPPYESMTFESAGKFFLVNLLGKSRNRSDDLKKTIHSFLEACFGKKDSSKNLETYAYAVQKLKTDRFNKLFREIAMYEALRKMAMKPPAW